MPNVVDLANPVTSHSLNTGLTEWWRTAPNGTYTTSIPGLISSGRTLAVANGAMLVADGLHTPNHKVIALDGINDAAGSPGDDAIYDLTAATGDFTLVCWVRLLDLTFSTFLAQNTGDGLNWWLYYSGGYLGLNFSRSSGSNAAFWAWTPSTSTWYSVTVTKTGNVYEAFINGVSLGTVTDSFSWVNKSGQFLAGAYNSVGTYEMWGRIDKIRIYSRALSSSEVSSLYSDDSNNDVLTLRWIASVGDLSVTLGSISLTGAGQIPVLATQSNTFGSLSLSADADLLVQSSLSSTLSGISLEATSQLEIQSSFSQPLESISVTADGVLPLQADGSTTLGSLEISAQAGIPALADLAVTFDTILGVQEGLVIVEVDEFAPFGNLELTGEATLSLTSQTSTTFDSLQVVAEGQVLVSAAASTIFEDLAVTVSGNSPRSAELDYTLASLDFSSSAEITIKSSLEGGFQGLSLESRAGQEVSASLACTFSSIQLEFAEAARLTPNLLMMQLHYQDH